MTLSCVMVRIVSPEAEEAHCSAAGEVNTIKLEQTVIPIGGRTYAESLGWRKLIDDVDVLEQGITDERERQESFWDRCRRKVR